MNWRSTAGKSALAKMLMKEHGFSKRKSERAVNAVFDCMARALRRGERGRTSDWLDSDRLAAGEEGETEMAEVSEYPDGKGIV